MYNNIEGNVSPLQPRNPNSVGSDYCNMTETQIKVFKTVSMDRIEVLKRKCMKYLKDVFETLTVNETVQDLNVEIESVK